MRTFPSCRIFSFPFFRHPCPFCVAFTRAILADALCDLSRECVVVDLDKNLVTLGPDTAPLPPLATSNEGDNWWVDWKKMSAWCFVKHVRLRKNDDYSGSGEKLQPHIKLMADAMWEGRLCLV